MDKKKENRQILWGSLEMAVVRRDLIIYAVIWIIFALIYGVRIKGEVQTVMMVVIALIMLPFIGFNLWRAIQIFRQADQYIFCRCKLSSPHQRYWSRGMMYFTVIVEDETLGCIPVETHAIFSSYGIMEPLLETYINSTVTIGYNPKTEMVVVVGL